MIGLLVLTATAMAALPAFAPAGWTRDIEFARVDGVSLTLDAYVPPGSGPHPAVIVVHGGSYVKGDKQTFVPPLFPALEGAGLAIFTINYRLAPQHRYPAAVEDVERALAFVRRRAGDFRVNPRRVALLGESAGGHLAALAALRLPRRDAPAAVVALYTAFDLPERIRQQGKVSQSVKDFFAIQDAPQASQKVLEDASPVRYLRRGMPPFLLLHGTADALVPYQQSVDMCARVHALEESCELVKIDGAGHGIEEWERDKRPGYKERIAGWLVAHLRHDR